MSEDKRLGRRAIRSRYIGQNGKTNVRYTIDQTFEMFFHTKSAEGLRKRTLADYVEQPDRNSYSGYRDYILMCLLLESGMRIGEALALQTTEIDLKARLINLSGAKNKNRRVRVIPISTNIMRMLMDLIDENQTYFPDTYHLFFGELWRAIVTYLKNSSHKAIRYQSGNCGSS